MTGARTKETKTYISGVEECTYENDKYGNPTTIKTCSIKKSDDGTEDKEYYPEINIEYTYEEDKITATEDSDHAGWTTYYTETMGGCGDFNESKKNPCGGVGVAHACFVCRLQEKQK